MRSAGPLDVEHEARAVPLEIFERHSSARVVVEHVEIRNADAAPGRHDLEQPSRHVEVCKLARAAVVHERVKRLNLAPRS